jgi:putative transposase
MTAPDHATKPFETILRERGIHTWHLDEIALMIAGTQSWLWRAVDDEGEVLDLLVQRLAA